MAALDLPNLDLTGNRESKPDALALVGRLASPTELLDLGVHALGDDWVGDKVHGTTLRWARKSTDRAES